MAHRTRHQSWRWALLFMALLVAGCAPSLAGTDRLRLRNDSGVAIEQIVVVFPDERIVFGPLAAGATSAYQPVKRGVYGYAAYELSVDGQIVRQPVTDWLGEEPMRGSRFTYGLTLDPQGAAPPIVQARVEVD